jgi:hypothetical protein
MQLDETNECAKKHLNLCDHVIINDWDSPSLGHYHGSEFVKSMFKEWRNMGFYV